MLGVTGDVAGAGAPTRAAVRGRTRPERGAETCISFSVIVDGDLGGSIVNDIGGPVADPSSCDPVKVDDHGSAVGGERHAQTGAKAAAVSLLAGESSVQHPGIIVEPVAGEPATTAE
jgi:hypothetical protein